MRILGIDPGLQRAGWGVIEKHGNRLSFIAAGVVSTSRAGEGLAVRLQCLHEGMQQVIAQYQPDQAAMEETFVNVNGASTMKLGQARGALLLSLTITGLHGLHVLAGVLIMLYFWLPVEGGANMFKRNPEHLANRVEVVGLFWHFVDLVWIFVFPIFYLL